MKCQVEYDSEDRKGIVHTTCKTCGTKWRRRESSGKWIYEKWAHLIPELSVSFPFVGGGIKLGPKWFRWAKIKERPLPAFAHPKTRDKQEPTKTGKTYDEKTLVDAHSYVYYDFELLKGDRVKGEIVSDAPIDVWFLDEENFDRFDRRKSFDEEDGTEAVYETKPDFEACRKGSWLVVIDNKNKTSAKASVNLHSE